MTKLNQMFTVTDVSGAETKVRKPVYMARVEKLRSLIAACLGLMPSTEEAIAALTSNYHNATTRAKLNVNFVGIPLEFLPAKPKAKVVVEAAKPTKPAAAKRVRAKKVAAPVTTTTEAVAIA